MVLGRQTRAFNNGQGIQDPRVSRQHLRLLLTHGEAYEANGVCCVQALGHNPSTIRRGSLASLGVGFHQEPNNFKLRRETPPSYLASPHIPPPPCLTPLPHAYPRPCHVSSGGDEQRLYPGDVIQLVCEEVSRAHGRSLAYEGNACAYQVEYIPPNDRFPPGTLIHGREADDTDEEASDEGGSVADQATATQPVAGGAGGGASDEP